MRSHAFLVWAGALLPCATALAGDVSIPVDDLTTATGRLSRPWMQPWPDPKGELTTTREERRSPVRLPFAPARAQQVVTGENGETRPGAPAQPDELVTCVEALSGTTGVRITPDRRNLRVPEASAEAVKRAVARLRAARPSFVDLDFALEAKDGGGWTTLLAGAEPVEADDRAVFEDAASRSYLSDFDVEIAQGSQIPDPILQILRTGSHVSLRVLPLPAGDAALVVADAIVATEVGAEPMRPEYSEMGEIDRAAVSVERAAVTLRVKPGEPGRCEWTGKGGRPLRLTVTARWTAARDAGSPVVLWSPLLADTGTEGEMTRHVPAAFVTANAEESEEFPRFGHTFAVPLAPPAPIERLPAEHALDAVLPFGNGALVLAGAGAAAARDSVVAEIDAENRAVSLHLAAWDVPAGAEAPAGDAPPEGAREILSAAAPLRVGLNGLFVAGECRTYIADWDVEVAQSSSIPDVIVGLLLTGSFANVTVRGGPGGTPAFVDLDVVLSKSVSMQRQSVPVLVPMPVATGAGFDVNVPDGKGGSGTKNVHVDPLASPTATALRSSYAVEKPVTQETRIAVTLPLSGDGRATLRRTLPGYLGPGREALVVVRVR